MNDIESDGLNATASNKNKRAKWSLILFYITFALILINPILLWLYTIEFPIGVEAFYWQRFNSYLLVIWEFSCLSIPVVIILWALVGIRKFRFSIFWFLSSIVLLFVCAFANYSAFFIVTYVSHVGTVELKDNVYHLAEVSKYDDETSYYLGKCDQTGFMCVFHEIYRTYLAERQTFSIELSGDLQSVIVKADGKSVYNFDGVHENCTGNYPGYCIKSSP